MSHNGIEQRRRTGRVIVPLTVDRLADLPDPCVSCTFWELGPAQVGPDRSSARADKQGWLTAALLEWGSPGRIAYVNGEPAGYLSYAPAQLVPRTLAFPTSPVSDDALVLLTARVRPEHRDQGLGRMLVQAAAKDGLRRGYRALEAFAATPLTPRRVASGGACLLPQAFLAEVGCQTVREHAAYPRMRLDLRTALTWRADIEAAVGRLFAPIRGLHRPPSPAGTTTRSAAPEGYR